MKTDIKLGQKFRNNGIIYICVGHDNGMIWGVENEFTESKSFDIHNCSPISEFTLTKC